MTIQRKINHNLEIFEIFKQVKINIHLLDVIKHVPSYAKCFKYLVHNEKKTECEKESFFSRISKCHSSK
jgi:hypothetical protein